MKIFLWISESLNRSSRISTKTVFHSRKIKTILFLLFKSVITRKNYKRKKLPAFIHFLSISLGVQEKPLTSSGFSSFVLLLLATNFVSAIKDAFTQETRALSKRLPWIHRITWRRLELETTLASRVIAF